MKLIPSIVLSLFVIFLYGCANSPGEVESLPDPSLRINPQSEPTPLPEPNESSSPSTSAVEEQIKASEGFPFPRMAFGTESRMMDFEGHSDILGIDKLQLIRHNGLLWHEIESIEGVRNWEAATNLEEKLIRASTNNLSTMLIVRGTPEWAQMVPGSYCGPIKPEKLAAFAQFMIEAVSRYSQAPFNVKIWELGNEPDVDPTLVSAKSMFGCWGNQNDPYYGGQYYADMLKTVYPAIKSVDPEATVLIGGLLLDCDPTRPPEGKDCNPGNFLEGILLNGGGAFFDAVSFHGYAPYFRPNQDISNPLFYDDHHPSWEHRGGVVIGKIDFLREVMSKYNLSKPIYHTEGALLCTEYNPIDCDPPVDEFYESQADYLIRMYLRNWGNRIYGTIWFSFEGPGWRYGSLLDGNQNPKPVYEALKFLLSELVDAELSGNISLDGNLEGYEFTTPEKRIWVVWSPEEIDTVLMVPGDIQAVYNKFGKDIFQPGMDTLVINEPIYIELYP